MPTADLIKVLAIVILVAVALAAFVAALGSASDASEVGQAAYERMSDVPTSSTGATADGYSPLAIAGAALSRVMELGPDSENGGFSTLQYVLFGGIALIVAFAAWGLAVKILGAR